MTYFLGRDVDVYVTLESLTDAAMGLEPGADMESGSPDSPMVGLIATGAVAPGGNIFANNMVDDATILLSRVHDLTGVDLSISTSDEEVGPFLGQVSTQSVELRKDMTITLTHKKGDEVWDGIYNGPSNGQEFENVLMKTTDVTFNSTTTLVCTSTADLLVGMFVVHTSVPRGTIIASISNATTAIMSQASNVSTASLSVGFQTLPTYLHQGGRFGVMYDGTDARISMGRTNPKSAVSGAVYALHPHNPVNYGYRVHIRLKDAVEVYTVRNAAITGHTVSLSADGVSEETLELKSTVLPVLYTGATNTFNNTLTVVGEM